MKRYSTTCPECGQFIKEDHNCERARLYANKFWCRGCKDYLKYDKFQRDATKRYGINTICKKCRAERGNGN